MVSGGAFLEDEGNLIDALTGEADTPTIFIILSTVEAWLDFLTCRAGSPHFYGHRTDQSRKTRWAATDMAKNKGLLL